MTGRRSWRPGGRGSAPAPMTCKALAPLVTEYLDHALPADQNASLEGHLADCPHCRAHLDQFQVTIAELGRLPTDAIDPVIHGELIARFERWRLERDAVS
jgi:anti-sigma factor RsiW